MPSPLAGMARFPRARLGHAPTPIDAAPNLGAALGIDLYVKRDDCTGLAFGGNKVRQLEFHFGEALAQGADTVLVTGAARPLRLRRTLRRPRSKSAAPRCVSSMRMRWATAGGVTPSSSPAWAKLRSRAAASKNLRQSRGGREFTGSGAGKRRPAVRRLYSSHFKNIRFQSASRADARAVLHFPCVFLVLSSRTYAERDIRAEAEHNHG